MADNSILRESPVKHAEWRIPHFFELSKKVNYKLDSPSFSFLNARWLLRLYPNGQTRNMSSGWIGMHLMKKKSSEEQRVIYTIGISRSDGSDFAVSKQQSTFPKQTTLGSSLVIDRSTLLSAQDDVAPDGTLTAFCTLRIMDRQFASPVNVESASQTNFDGAISSLLEDFKNMYINRLCSDVTLLVKNEEFYAHQNVLIARSPVFHSMFVHDWSEKRSGKVEIPDCDPSSFEQFLLFLYTGKLDNVCRKTAVNLYKTADKYDVRTLKLECVDIMRRNLCVNFFCDIIHLAMVHRELDLLKDAKSFFIDNAEAILSTTKWQQFLEENSSLCNELLQLVKIENLRNDTN